MLDLLIVSSFIVLSVSLPTLYATASIKIVVLQPVSSCFVEF